MFMIYKAVISFESVDKILKFDHFPDVFFERGTQSMNLVVTKGAPLPFAFDILMPQHQYGSKLFVKYPADIPDFIKQSFPEGYSWERIMTFEDGAVCTVSNNTR